MGDRPPNQWCVEDCLLRDQPLQDRLKRPATYWECRQKLLGLRTVEQLRLRTEQYSSRRVRCVDCARQRESQAQREASIRNLEKQKMSRRQQMSSCGDSLASASTDLSISSAGGYLLGGESDDTEMDGVSESMEGSSAHADEDSTDQSLAVAYAFKGIYQLYDFDAPNAATCVRFGNSDASVLASGSSSGCAFIQNISEPESPPVVLQGHTQGVSDMDWSLGNEYLATASWDGSIRLWNSSSGVCIRVLFANEKARTHSPSFAVRFHPMNSNLLFGAFASGYVMLFNLSSGRIIQEIKMKGSISPTSMAMDTQGSKFFVGDKQGAVHTFVENRDKDKYIHATSTQVVPVGKPVTSLCFSTWYSAHIQNRPVLLANACVDQVILLTVEETGSLVAVRRFPIVQRSRIIRSSLCPLISLREGACFGLNPFCAMYPFCAM